MFRSNWRKRRRSGAASPRPSYRFSRRWIGWPLRSRRWSRRSSRSSRSSRISQPGGLPWMAVGQLQADLGDIRAQLEKIAAGAPSTSRPAPDSTQADAPLLHIRQSDDGHGQIGHRGALLPRVSASEGPILTTPVPANGTYRTPFPSAPLPPPPSLQLVGSSAVFGGSRSTNNKHME